MAKKGMPPKALMGNKASTKSSGKLIQDKINGNSVKSGRFNEFPKKKMK